MTNKQLQTKSDVERRDLSSFCVNEYGVITTTVSVQKETLEINGLDYIQSYGRKEWINGFALTYMDEVLRFIHSMTGWS